jgi:hypothetical protein
MKTSLMSFYNAIDLIIWLSLMVLVGEKETSGRFSQEDMAPTWGDGSQYLR